MSLVFFSIAVAVGGNLLYHVSQKSIPSSAPPLLSLLVTYGVALLVTGFLVPFFPAQPPFREGLRRLNWASAAVGLAIVGVELGFLLAYRAGWRMSVGSVAVNVVVALLLIPAGVVLFRERLTASNVAGLLLCLAGLLLIARN